MAHARAHRHRAPGRRGRRPSLRLRGGLLIGAVALVCAALTTAPPAPTATAVPVADTAHSWFSAGPASGTTTGGFFSAALRFFQRGPGGSGPGHRPPAGGPTPPATTTDPPSSTTTPTTAPSPTTPVTPPAPLGDPNTNCTLIVPPGALTAAGLATPYRFTATDPTAGPCHEANPDQSAFVEATILDPATGALSVYHPLVVDDGTQPAAAPVVPTLPPGAVVGVWFGFQADTLSLHRDRARRGIMNLRAAVADACVTGLPGSPFTQYSYCGAPRFFAAANAAIRAGRLAVPPLGTGADSRPCPSTRDFSVVDQDQSDNLPTRYLATSDGRTAQNSAADRAALPDATVLSNGSDNGLVDDRLDPALHCTPFTAPDLSAGGVPSAALALNELQAAAHQQAPVALVPPTDPMTLVDGRTSVLKTDLYRAGVDMPPMNSGTDTGPAYCTNIETVAPARLQLDRPFTAAAASPDPAAANLFEFLTQRLTATWTNLGCQDLTGHGAPVVGAAATTAPTTTTAPTPTSVTPAPAAPATTTDAPVTSAADSATADVHSSTSAATTTTTSAALHR